MPTSVDCPYVSEFHAAFVVISIGRHKPLGAWQALVGTKEKFCRSHHPMCFKRSCKVLFHAALLNHQYDPSKIKKTAWM